MHLYFSEIKYRRALLVCIWRNEEINSDKLQESRMSEFYRNMYIYLKYDSFFPNINTGKNEVFRHFQSCFLNFFLHEDYLY